ncbi:hypothetical protein [Streptomyces lavendulae]|uniref:hypothetical protein n=1 Tax=Streptomyces lavendulae TaxID=1914 RepID=UPI0031EAB157
MNRTNSIAADDACVLCGFWTCKCSSRLDLARAVTAVAPTDSDLDEALRRARAGR